MIYLVGGYGFIGSAFARLFKRRGLEFRIIGRNDYEKLAGLSCDVLINANGNSKKFLADRDTLAEFDASVKSVLMSLNSFRFARYVHLSSGDVYPNQSQPELTIEDAPILVEHQSRYGLHKYLAEQLVRNYAADWLVIRMGGFIGPNMKKNAIFDMLTNAPIWLTPDSELQYIHTDTAAEMIWQLVENGINRQIVNLGAEGVVQIGALYRKIGAKSNFHPDARQIRFELSLSKLQSLLGRPLPSAEDEVTRFVNEWRLKETGEG